MATTTENSSNNETIFKRCFKMFSPLKTIINVMLNDLHIIEQFYIKLYNIYAFISQMLFFFSCALVFEHFDDPVKNEEFVLIGLKSLLFYSVFTYFVTKTRDILHSGRPSLFQNWNLAEGLCRIIIEWAKAIIVVICLREQGIHFKPTPAYAILTFTYYLCTERIFSEIFLKIFKLFSFEVLDDLEHLYVPMLLNFYTVTLSFSTNLYLSFTTDFKVFNFMSFYFTVYIRIKDSYYNHWKILRLSKQTFENFRNATPKELEDYDDICAVCLNKMSKAKITPCNHFFHPACLKECLKNSFFCPLCKLSF